MITTKKYTYKEYYNLDDGKRYEIIKGELIEMSPAPNYFHQKILGRIYIELSNYIESKKIGEIILSPLDIIFDKYNVLQPDILFISDEKSNIIKKKGIFGAPDLVIEILSPSTTKKDKNDKFKIYEKFAVKEYWIVDPDDKRIEIFVLEKNQFSSYCLLGEKDKVNSKLLPDLTINITHIFKGL